MSESKDIYDVIIVGAGPAGGICSYELSKRQLKVLILEKEKLPRYKVCAGGLTKRAVDILPNDLRFIVENQTFNVKLTYNHKHGFPIRTSFPLMTMVMRDNFDYSIVQKSMEMGCQLKDKSRVKSVEEYTDYILVKTDNETYKSKVVVGADGVTSKVARLLGLRNNLKLGVAIEGEIFPINKIEQVKNYDGSIHLDINVIPRGYGWIFPKHDHLSVGVFTTQSKIKNIKEYYIKYLENKCLCNDFKCQSLIGHQIPIGGSRKEVLNTKRGILVGDAAGLADPITGEGLCFALKSAQIAADEIHKFLKNEDHNLDEYSKRVYDEIVKDLVYGFYLSRIFYSLGFIAYRLLRDRKRIINAGIRLLTSDISYREIVLNTPGKLFRIICPLT